ncbi:hypothetical protein CCP2SC5_1900003 [Azospirillaceae bacterium]
MGKTGTVTGTITFKAPGTPVNHQGRGRIRDLRLTGSAANIGKWLVATAGTPTP